MRYRYQTIEFDEIDIHLRTLRDTNEFADRDGEAEALGISPANWPLFGVVWSSSIVLAGLMADVDIDGRRILEVGCGIGLASIVLNHRGADITAMDRHPQAQSFMEHNTALNNAPSIPFQQSDWRSDSADLGQFDLIIGSDLLYERDHAAQLSRFADEHAVSTGKVILIDPGRGHAGRFTRDMSTRGFQHRHEHAARDTRSHHGHAVGARIQVHSFERG